MNGFQLTFFTEQDRRHDGKRVVDWLVQLTKELGLPGVTVIPASEGMGHHHRIHSARFFELADQPVSVVMIVSAEEAERLFERLQLNSACWAKPRTAECPIAPNGRGAEGASLFRSAVAQPRRVALPSAPRYDSSSQWLQYSVFVSSNNGSR